MLKLQGVCKTYKGGVKALKGVDLEVKQGDFFGLLGPNGAGKTTLIGIVTGLVKKSGGKVVVRGLSQDKFPDRVKKFLGVVPQEINLWHLEKVIDVVVNQAGYYGIPRFKALKLAETYLKQLGLWEKRFVQTKTLSGGMKRRLMIARALAHEPKLLILDEPSAGIDVELRLGMWKFLKKINQAGVTIILTTHYLEEAEQLCNKIGIIDKGVLLEFTTTKDLILKLEHESYVFDLDKPVRSLSSKKFSLKVLGSNSVELFISKNSSLNDFFRFLDKKGFIVLSMRNKSNRLEQLFVDIVGEKR